MKGKQLIIGIIILAVCVGGYFGLRAYNANQEKKEAAKTVTPVEVNKDEVTGFTYMYDDGVLIFQKDGDNWQYKDNTDLDISEDTVNTMLEAICEVTSDEKVTAENLSDYGFDTPENTITLITSQGTTEVSIGMYNDMLSKYYMNINGSNDMYLVSGDVVTAFNRSLDDLTVVADDSDSTEATTDTTDSESADSTDAADSETTDSETTDSTDTADSETTENADTTNSNDAAAE